jgi:hypothetical protein
VDLAPVSLKDTRGCAHIHSGNCAPPSVRTNRSLETVALSRIFCPLSLSLPLSPPHSHSPSPSLSLSLSLSPSPPLSPYFHSLFSISAPPLLFQLITFFQVVSLEFELLSSNHSFHAWNMEDMSSLSFSIYVLYFFHPSIVFLPHF